MLTGMIVPVVLTVGAYPSGHLTSSCVDDLVSMRIGKLERAASEQFWMRIRSPTFHSLKSPDETEIVTRLGPVEFADILAAANVPVP
ncbi:hypothetical protein B0I00_2887 [Novosphingobium kunmingense]|uniref:Uncharacterized protein n=1 Tax=Novosphingobium kunmingense TaxID=1211806 RepID=A0A2N0H5N9_9SPHN|nr:hypothetical protein B0I00_2887 [Novosphingobium kunmingense]